MQWIPFAMVRIAVIFAAGALLCIYAPDLIKEETAMACVLVSTAFYFVVRFSLQGNVMKGWTGIVGLTAIFLGGYWNVMLRSESRIPEHIINCPEKILAYQVNLITSAEEKEKSWKRTGSISGLKTENGWRLASGKVNLYWPKTEAIANLDYGDALVIAGTPRVVEGQHNPHEFDLKRFLAFKNIYHQQFVRPGQWALVKKSSDRGFLFYAHRARTWSVNTIKEFVKSPREQAIVIALVLGVTDGLDNELLTAYAASGAMHVLAVSGLHVSIIYGILLLLFKPLGKGQTGQWFIAIVSLILLWGYAFITGLSPSVLRAVAMFSFVAIAKPIGRNTNIYNTLAASAFCLLLYDPYLIMSVGFQLSYLAVIGIVYFQRPIYYLWEAKSWFTDWAWQLSCVSIAAQLSTMAISLLYFHQFPVYFLLANLFIIPASFVVLIGGILLLMVGGMATVASWLGIFLDWFVRIMNEGIFLVEKLPLSVIDGLYVSTWQAWMIAAFTIAAIALVQFRKFFALPVLLMCVACFALDAWQHLYLDVDKSVFNVYRVQGHSVLEWTRHGRAVISTDSVVANDRKAIKFHLEPNHLANGVTDIVVDTSYAGFSFFKVDGKTFLWIRSGKQQLPDSISADYLIIGNDSVASLKAACRHIEFGKLVFDSSNSYRYCERMLKEAAEIKIFAHSVLNDGAFTTDI
ncbi:MAG TPA: ComEC/Rec2 family competence protein [Cyclobacteriaceae bacterium]|nr:ComEC/Rec2 family competence protein [Cyclobacteriaceae bacterium]